MRTPTRTSAPNASRKTLARSATRGWQPTALPEGSALVPLLAIDASLASSGDLLHRRRRQPPPLVGQSPARVQSKTVGQFLTDKSVLRPSGKSRTPWEDNPCNQNNWGKTVRESS